MSFNLLACPCCKAQLDLTSVVEYIDEVIEDVYWQAKLDKMISLFGKESFLFLIQQLGWDVPDSDEKLFKALF